VLLILINLAEEFVVSMNQKGETLIEAMLAIAIILMALIGVLSLSSFNYFAGKETFNRNIAGNLAREGVEIIRNQRDSNWLQGCFDLEQKIDCAFWNSHLAEGVSIKVLPYFDETGRQWKLTPTDSDILKCSADESCLVKKTPDGFYGSESAVEETKFSRLVEINPICANIADCGGDGICVGAEKCFSEQIGLRVVSMVRWTEPQGVRNVKLEERLYNWR